MRRTILTLLVLALAAVPAAAQQRLQLEFPGLAERAVEVVDVTLDAQMLRLAANFFSSARDPETKAVRDIVNGLQGIYVRAYKFDRDGAYDPRLVEGVRRQLAPSWKKIVNVVSRGRENVEVYTDVRGDVIAGLVVIAAEPRELTIVNIVGPLDIARLAQLEGQFGVPRMQIEVKEKR